MTATHAAKKAANYEILTTRIRATLRAYEALLKAHESDLNQYVNDNIPLPLIKVQELLIIKLKAKIEILTDLNK